MFFFFKQKTAYEMRISDWSSDVCSSDLSDALGESLGIGNADLFGCHNGQSTEDELHVLSALEHLREPVESCIGVRSAHRFLQGADHVKMVLAILVAIGKTGAKGLRYAGDVERLRKLHCEEAFCLVEDRKSTRLNSS